MHDGVINLNKPAGISSARAVARVKRRLPRGVKIGHAGTLDPFATGVLLLLVGRATRQCETLMNAPKQYEAAVKLGATTATDDPESPEESFAFETDAATTTITRDQIETAVKRFIGAIQQRPPAFSALKVSGRRAYDLARKGHDVNLAARTVQVYRIEVLSYQWPHVALRIDCGRGTYIRAIARDLGAALGIGGYLTALRRTAVGPFRADDAVTLEQIDACGDNIAQLIQPIDTIAGGLATLRPPPYNDPPGGEPPGSTGKDRS